MEYGSLNKDGKELKKAILILDAKALSLIIAACEEYQKNHPKMKNIKLIIAALDDIAVF